jgi:hypothetical protein
VAVAEELPSAAPPTATWSFVRTIRRVELTPADSRTL